MQLGLVGHLVPILMATRRIGIIVSVVEFVLHFALFVGGLRRVLRVR